MYAALARRASTSDTSFSSYWPLDLDLSCFPPVVGSIGYGSGVFRQKGYDGTRPMVDVVLVVRDRNVEDWHAENIEANPSHYSSLPRMIGCARLQRWGPGLYYNPHVRLPTAGGDELEAKYGVVSAEALLADLRGWSSLYMAGRMHKPCALAWHGDAALDGELREAIEAAIAKNRRSALVAAALGHGWGTGTFGRHLHKAELLEAIVRLSYDGDIRQGIAESPMKIKNIAERQEADLWRIYKPIAAELGVLPAKDLTERSELFGMLPREIQTKAEKRAKGVEQAVDDMWVVPTVLRGIVRRASLQQTAKGFITAGPRRSAVYAMRKLGKRFR